jgi:hypothetical protein
MKNKINLHDAYEILRKKKERDRLAILSEKEKVEMKACTFQPNVDKLDLIPDYKEISDKLYHDAKERIKKKNEQKEEELPDDFTFKPIIGE